MQTYILTWILLFAATIIIGKTGVGGAYFLSAWNAVVFLGCVIGNIQGIIAARATKDERATSPPIGDDLEASETTPLLVSNHQNGKAVGTQHGEMLWWLVELLVVVPLPLILMTHVGVLMVTAMNQTITDGGNPSSVYAMVSLLTVLLVLPIAPFGARMSKGLTAFIVIVFVATTAYSWLAFPFSADAPLKVYFQQKISVSDSTTVTKLVGVGRYLEHDVMSKLPSAQHPNANVTCGFPAEGRRQGLTTCTWNSGEALSPSSGGQGDRDWLDFNVTRLEGDVSVNKARISLSGDNTKGCKVYFENANITGFYVHGGSGGMQTGYEMPEGGITQIRLWSREWGNEFTLDVEWAKLSSETKLIGRVGCDWAEYESGSVGLGLPTARIPALEEALTFLPKWAVVTKLASGLVEVTDKFEV